MNEKLKVHKSCLNCYNFCWTGEADKDAFCTEHCRHMPSPRSNDDPDYGYCFDYVYQCYYCDHDCCPKNPENIEFV